EDRLGGGGLAASGLADQGEHLTLGQRERHALHRVDGELRLPAEGSHDPPVDRVAGHQVPHLEERVAHRLPPGPRRRRGKVRAHWAAPTVERAEMSFRWQAAWWPGSMIFRTGRSYTHRSNARSQRGRNGQPWSTR